MAKRRQIYFEQTGQKIATPNSQVNNNYAIREERRNEQPLEYSRSSRENSEILPRAASRVGESINGTARTSNQLTSKLQSLINSPRCRTGMIGVFGMNSDILIQRTLYDIRNQDVVIFNKIDITNTGNDIYNFIAAAIINEIKNNDRYRVSYRDISYDTREIFGYLQELYSSPRNEEAEYWESGIRVLNRMAVQSERDEKFKKIIEKMQRSFYGANTKFIFVISTGTNPLASNTLEMIRKISFENVIFIIESLVPQVLQRNAINASVGGYEAGGNLFARYFSSTNIVLADNLD